MQIGMVVGMREDIRESGGVIGYRRASDSTSDELSALWPEIEDVKSDISGVIRKIKEEIDKKKKRKGSRELIYGDGVVAGVRAAVRRSMRRQVRDESEIVKSGLG